MHIDRPLFLLPENKAAIAQLKNSPAIAMAAGFNGPWFKDSRDDHTTVKELGCLIGLDLGTLIVRNGYTQRPIGHSIDSSNLRLLYYHL